MTREGVRHHGVYLISAHGGVGLSEPGGHDASGRSVPDELEAPEDVLAPEDALAPDVDDDDEPPDDDDVDDELGDFGVDSVSPPHAVSATPATTMAWKRGDWLIRYK